MNKLFRNHFLKGNVSNKYYTGDVIKMQIKTEVAHFPYLQGKFSSCFSFNLKNGSSTKFIYKPVFNYLFSNLFRHILFSVHF